MAQVGTNDSDPETYFNNSDPVIYGLDGDDFIRWTGFLGADGDLARTAAWANAASLLGG